MWIFFHTGLGGSTCHQQVFVMGICLVLDAVGSQSAEAPVPAWAHCLQPPTPEEQTTPNMAADPAAIALFIGEAGWAPPMEAAAWGWRH